VPKRRVPLNIPSNEVDNWARIQADRFQNMVIRGFHTELEAVYEEYNMHLTSDFDKEWAALRQEDSWCTLQLGSR
jgi:hypothetical protein